jgi:tetratricopeptide (TPR) repeat protein
MPVRSAKIYGLNSASALALLLMTALPSQAQNFWQINAPGVSQEVTGTSLPFALGEREVPTAAEQLPMTLAQLPATPAQAEATDGPAPVVDESALRYFARQGDTRRLEIEIARLRALYPQWLPPSDPLAVPVNVDERLEAIWQLYSQGRLAEARQAIVQRQSDEAGWQPPADLVDRLALAEARERLVNASSIKQYETVIRIGSENPHLLTCTEVDVLWRVAEAFASTERQDRALDAYRYILTNCDNPRERLATVQNASQLLAQRQLDELLALERTDANGVGEFLSVRDDVARNIVARGDDDPSFNVPASELSRIEKLATENRTASDARLLGWYYIRRENFTEAEKWFRMARETEDSADASQGLALALIARDQHAEAEAVIYPWRGENDDTRKVYLASAANLLGVEPRPALSNEVLQRIVAEAAQLRDVPTARQLGWYARAWEQHQTAGQWFLTALGWDQDDEPSAYGLALTRHLLGDAAGLAEIKRIWAGRSERIQRVGVAATEPAPQPTSLTQPTLAPLGYQQQPTASAPAATAPAAVAAPRPAPQTQATAPRSVQRAAPAQRRGGCSTRANPTGLSTEAALQLGWCLMDANRPMEAVKAFDRALQSSTEQHRRDAAWGKSLAYLRLELVDDAAAAAVSAPLNANRSKELQTAILAQRAAGAFQQGRFVETLMALDQRANLAAERIDLMVLRGYAYLNLNRLGDAQRTFKALAGTGDREGIRGLAAVRQRIEQQN